MRHFIFIIFLGVAVSLFGNEKAKDVRMKIIGALAHTLTKKEFPYIYTDSDEFSGIRSSEYGFIATSTCNNADVVFIKDAKKLVQVCPSLKQKKVIMLSYKDYIEHEDKAIGAFFWQKGRPNIILNKKLLQLYNIDVPQYYEKYIE